MKRRPTGAVRVSEVRAALLGIVDRQRLLVDSNRTNSHVEEIQESEPIDVDAIHKVCKHLIGRDGKAE